MRYIKEQYNKFNNWLEKEIIINFNNLPITINIFTLMFIVLIITFIIALFFDKYIN